MLAPGCTHRPSRSPRGKDRGSSLPFLPPSTPFDDVDASPSRGRVSAIRLIAESDPAREHVVEHARGVSVPAAERRTGYLARTGASIHCLSRRVRLRGNPHDPRQGKDPGRPERRPRRDPPLAYRGPGAERSSLSRGRCLVDPKSLYISFISSGAGFSFSLVFSFVRGFSIYGFGWTFSLLFRDWSRRRLRPP